eukprot:TRINITY_DN11915_c1_g1_i6.p1 TRINITY_DN11915_c1_g1~~TRINITY_DN11915_c1_g1_i6.p1  ORF type:complete len:207 (-),score=23.15 TRINITY_DN11915_c1_g1_i6:537-1157(-)
MLGDVKEDFKMDELKKGSAGIHEDQNLNLENYCFDSKSVKKSTLDFPYVSDLNLTKKATQHELISEDKPIGFINHTNTQQQINLIENFNKEDYNNIENQNQNTDNQSLNNRSVILQNPYESIINDDITKLQQSAHKIGRNEVQVGIDIVDRNQDGVPQPHPMVLNVDQFLLSSPEVIDLEIDKMDLSQLQQLDSMLNKTKAKDHKK